MLGRLVMYVMIVVWAWGGQARAATCPEPPLDHLQGQWALAVTWQPGFCEVYGRSKMALPVECPQSSDVTHLTLHGLWPQWREYCGDGLLPADIEKIPDLIERPCGVKRSDMPKVGLPDALQTRLATTMPGVRSMLERHEWFKHGTCSWMTQQDYFATALDLVDALNASSLADFLRRNIGRDVTVKQMCAAIQQALGPRAVQAVEADSRPMVESDGRRRFYLTELRFWLKPVEGRLGLTPDHFVPVVAGTDTLGEKPANPLCDDPPNHTVYIDQPGMGR